MVTTLDIYKEIRRLQLDGVTSQRTAAKLLGISRNTVRKYWEGATVPWDRKSYERNALVLTPEVVLFVKACLDEDDAEKVKKQQHTARRIYDRLVKELGFKGAESTIRSLVHNMRADRKSKKVFVPLRFMPGEAVQIDWGEATIYMRDEKVKTNLFCARLCHSCAPYVLAYKRQNLESFLDAIIRTIRYFGGTPRKFIFDNAKVAVKSGFGAHAIAQDDYKQLSAHYGFEPVFCNPASGNEKGLVENLVGYIRRNVCVPLPRVNNLDELNVKLLEKCVEYLQHQVEGRPAKVGVMLEEDRRAFQPIPTYVPDISKKMYPNVSRYSTVTFENNRYSVPYKYVGKSTTVKAFPNHIEVWCSGAMIARHDRLFGRSEESLDLQHYLPILARKGRALRYARPVQYAGPSEFLDWMERQGLTAKQMVEMLEQCVEVGYAAVMSGFAYQSSDGAVEDPVSVPDVDLEAYDSLFGKGAAVS